jgi:hypothetical protein
LLFSTHFAVCICSRSCFTFSLNSFPILPNSLGSKPAGLHINSQSHPPGRAQSMPRGVVGVDGILIFRKTCLVSQRHPLRGALFSLFKNFRTLYLYENLKI